MRKLFFSALLFGAIFSSCSDDDFSYDFIADNTAEPVKAAEGFYLVNEGWFGHDTGSVNYFKNKNNGYDISYNVYAAANGEQTLGVTTCHSAIWGNNIYFISKQGNCLVVADAKTLKSKAVITDLGGKSIEGRAFQGINEKKAYLGTTNGIIVFNLESNSLENKVNGINGQIGNMAYSFGNVFAITNKAIFIINPETDEIIKQIEGKCLQMTSDRNGNVIVALNDKMLLINGETLDTEDIAYPNEGKPADIWGMWNPGSMSASMKSDHIYWIGANGWFGGKTIFKTDLTYKTSKPIYSLGKSENNVNMEFYGAGLRVDPLTDELITFTTQSGWGDNYKFNWIYKIDNEGKEIMHQSILNKEGKDYFWFPSLPVFEDANKPQILLNQVVLKANAKAEINLTEKVIDYDNTFSTMIFSVESANPTIATASINGKTLVVEPGVEEGFGTLTLSVVSNGVKVEKTIQIVNEL